MEALEAVGAFSTRFAHRASGKLASGCRYGLGSLPAPYERSKVTCEWLAWLVQEYRPPA